MGREAISTLCSVVLLVLEPLEWDGLGWWGLRRGEGGFHGGGMEISGNQVEIGYSDIVNTWRRGVTKKETKNTNIPIFRKEDSCPTHTIPLRPG